MTEISISELLTNQTLALAKLEMKVNVQEYVLEKVCRNGNVSLIDIEMEMIKRNAKDKAKEKYPSVAHLL